MLELRSPLARVLDGPGLLMQRITNLAPRFSLHGVDVDRLLLSMAEADPEYLTYLDSEGLLPRHGSRAADEQAWLS